MNEVPEDGMVHGNPILLSPEEHETAVALAKHINDLLIGVRTDVALWALGYSGAVGALFMQNSNPDFPDAGMQYLADVMTVSANEFKTHVEELENGN